MTDPVFPIFEDDDWYSLEIKTNGILQKTLLSDLKRYIAGEIKPVAQDLRKKSTTSKYNEYMKIGWATEDGQEIYNKVNSYPFIIPTDYCYTFLSDKKIVIKKAAFINSQATLPKLGQFHVQSFTLLVQAKNGIIACNLFSGLRVKDSILFILKRKGEFD